MRDCLERNSPWPLDLEMPKNEELLLQQSDEWSSGDEESEVTYVKLLDFLLLNKISNLLQSV